MKRRGQSRRTSKAKEATQAGPAIKGEVQSREGSPKNEYTLECSFSDWKTTVPLASTYGAMDGMT
jgi:hypothetical protein